MPESAETRESRDGGAAGVRSARVRRRDVAAFFRELSILIDVGIPLVQALKIMAGRTSNKELAKVVQDLAETVEGGESLSRGMARYPRAFSEFEVSMVRVGERGGSMEEALRRLSDWLEEDLRLRSKTIFSLLYPVFALSAAAILVVFLLVVVVPIFEKTYAEADAIDVLPGATRFMIAISHVLRSAWIIVFLLILIGAVFGLVGFLRSEGGRRTGDSVKLNAKIPVVGNLGRKAAVARWAAAMAMLIRSGVTVIDALRVSAGTARNVHIREAVEGAANKVEAGENVAEALEQTRHFPPLALDMISVGDRAGALDVVLEKVAQTYKSDVEMGVEATNRIMEPVLIVLLAVVILMILLAVYLPYFRIYETIES